MTGTINEQFLNGPDQVISTNSYRTWKADGVVQLRTHKNCLENLDYVSVPSVLKAVAAKYPHKVAIKYKRGSALNEVTYCEYEKICRIVAKAFLKLGLERHHAVCILGSNAPEWIYSALAAIYAGGFQAGIYPSSSPEACLYYITLSSANIVVVEDDEQLQKILAIKSELKDLKAIVQYTGKPSVKGVFSWNDIIRIGKGESDDGLENELKNIAINQCCTVIYTSGTTSLPKAVMLNHDNMLSGGETAGNFICRNKDQEHRILSYLPMNHIISQMMDIFMSLIIPCTTYIADKNCLKETMVENLKTCRPTGIVGVPRVWEKLKDELMQYERNFSFIHRWILKFAKKVALTHYENLSKGYNYESILYKIFKFTIYDEMKRSIGLNYCDICVTGGAPCSVEIKKYFYSLDMPIIEIYGMSETAGLCIYSAKEDYIENRGGKIASEKIRIKLWNPNSEGYGEICFNGRGVFMGYMNDEIKTLETIEPDGWMHSGDVGLLDNKNYLKLTGRLKEMIITAGGINIPAPLIEQTLKLYLPVISNAVLIGDRQKYLTTLLTLKTEIDPKSGIPSDELTSETKDWCRSLGCHCNTVSEILREKPEKVYEMIQDAIDKANEAASSKAHKIQKFQILPRDFSTATEELSPTLKLKRSFIYEKYQNLIDEMYR